MELNKETELRAPENENTGDVSPSDGCVEAVKHYTAEELAARRRAEKQAAVRKARAYKDKYLEFYDDIKQREKPSW